MRSKNGEYFAVLHYVPIGKSMKIIKLVLAALLVYLWLLPVTAFGCACCAERGYHSLETEKLDGYILDEIKRLRFESATLYTDVSYPENLMGIDPLIEEITTRNPATGSIWKPIFEIGKVKKGTLNLLMAPDYDLFMTDREPLSERTTVSLYKELRIRNEVSIGSGFLASGIDKTTRYELVLQGNGNLCTNADDFKTYVLKISGKNANYSFYGSLLVKEDEILQKRGDRDGSKAIKVPVD